MNTLCGIGIPELILLLLLVLVVVGPDRAKEAAPGLGQDNEIREEPQTA